MLSNILLLLGGSVLALILLMLGIYVVSYVAVFIKLWNFSKHFDLGEFNKKLNKYIQDQDEKGLLK